MNSATMTTVGQRINGRIASRGILFILSLSLLQCGAKDGVSSQVTYSANPSQPIVIDTNFTLKEDDGDGDPDTFTLKEIQAPWFLFGYKVKNNSSKTITIANFKMTITGSKSNVPVVFETKIDLTALGDNTTYLEEIAPGGSNSRTDAEFYITGLPKDVDSFAYVVKVDVQGWVGKSNSPEDRLTGTFTFVTKP